MDELHRDLAAGHWTLQHHEVLSHRVAALAHHCLKGLEPSHPAAQQPLELPLFAVAWGWAPTLHFRLLDRASSVLIDSAHLAASYAYYRALETLGEWGLGVEVEMLRTRFTLTREMGEHARGPVHSILRMRGERRKETLKEGCSTTERLLIERGVL